MKRLFCIRELHTRRVVPDLWYDNKELAKKKRDELGKDKHAVTYGPDHRKYRVL